MCRREAAPCAALAVVTVLCALVSCDKATAPPPVPSYTITALSGDGTRAEVGDAVSGGVTVRVSAGPDAAAGVPVTWSAEDGSTASPATSTTDAHGLASASWVVGSKPGAYHLSAAVTGAAVRLSATALAGAPATLQLKARSITLRDLGDTASLAISAADRFGNIVAAAPPQWRSLAPTVVMVSPQGLITGLSAGTGRVVVSAGLLGDTATVEVRRPAAAVSASPRSLSLGALGASARISATASDRLGREMAATIGWSTSDSSVANVDTAGVVTARGNGRAVIRARADSARDSTTVTVRQLPVRVLVNPDTLLLGAGDSARISASVLDSLGSALGGAAITWSSRDPALAVVAGGWAWGSGGVGWTKLTARSDTLAADISVRVVPGKPVHLSVVPDVAALPVGNRLQLQVAGKDAFGNEILFPVGVTWSSSDPSRASVGSGGAVTGIAPGTVTVTATLAGVQASAQITVY